MPALSNVTFGPNVYPFLEKPARDRLVEAITASPSKKISFNPADADGGAAVLLWRWYQQGTLRIGLAAKPGNSNHETGLAFDTDDRAAWRSALSAKGFKWLGSADPVHFDYAGAGAKDYRGLDVKAFQRLWNLNNPERARSRKTATTGRRRRRVCARRRRRASRSGRIAGARATSDEPGPSAPACARSLRHRDDARSNVRSVREVHLRRRHVLLQQQLGSDLRGRGHVGVQAELRVKG